MRPLILIPCTDRKRLRPEESLRARDLRRGSISEVAKEWGERVHLARHLSKPHGVYCGRSFKEAKDAAEELGAELVVISAGLGLVRQQDEIPTYSLTVSNGRADSIGSKIEDSNWSGQQWWKAIGTQTAAITSLRDTLEASEPSLVLISLSSSYARLLSGELAGLEGGLLKRLRIFGAGLSGCLPAEVAEAVMPYDVRLNGDDSPLRGTMSDFGSRALRHYANCLLTSQVNGSSVESDRHTLSKIMTEWSTPENPKRERLSDGQVINFILENWGATGGRSGVTLRLLRDSGHACEQGRFKELFHLARDVQEEAEVKSG